MRPLILVFVILIFGLCNSKAQTYFPFPTKNTIWTEMYYGPYPDYVTKFHCFGLKDGDTTINGYLYHKLYHATDTIFTENDLCGGLREENKKVYYYSIEPITYNWWLTVPKDTEVILYNFSLKVGDTIKENSMRVLDMLILHRIDSILVGNDYRKRYYFFEEDFGSFCSWVEGLGYLRGLLFLTGDIPTNGLWNDIICFKQDNQVLYHYDRYKECYYKLPDVIKDIDQANIITIKPNPVPYDAIIDFPLGKFNQLVMYNLYGIPVKEFNITGSSYIEINRDGMPGGIYFIRLTGKNGESETIKAIFE